ncbi:NitT/TauT family transport system substrate-binding protein [termite gut metagenome]|uniref:NitT/TauT family transport system substrate-binding protein n=1 Tax=termite gut metagenome TaxID=433724 RepID=A0A5J4S452_9ZZZZ
MKRINYTNSLRGAGIVVAVALTAMLYGCGNSSRTKGVSDKFPFGEIEIQALSSNACGAPAFIAKEKGFFEEEGIDVTLTSGDFETSKLGLASGRFAVANGDFQYFPSIQEGLDIKLISGLHQGCIQVLVPAGSDIKTAKDLAGKRIGVDELGGSPMAITSVLLVNNGIDPVTGVTWLPFPKEVLPTVADRGEVDAVALWDPFGPLAVKRGYTVICDIGIDPLFAGKYCCFLYASGKQIKENPERIKALLRAYQKASEWIAAHPAETAEIITQKGYVPSDDPEFIAELLKSYEYHSKHGISNKIQAKEDARYFVRELKKTGFLSKDTDPDKFVENLYVDVLGDEDNDGKEAVEQTHEKVEKKKH